MSDGSWGGWAAPDSAAEQPSHPAAAAAAEPAPRGPTPAPRRVTAPVPLRPMTAADVLDGGFAILKADPRKIVTIVAAFVVPLQALTAYAQRDLFRDKGFLESLNEAFSTGTFDASTSTNDTSSGISFLLAVLGWLVLPFVAGALAVVVWGWFAGVDVSPGRALGMVARRSWALLLAWVGVHVTEFAGLFGFGVGSLVFMAFFVVTAPAIVLERLGPFAGMGRSWRLVSGRFFPVLGIALLTGLVASLLDTALSSAALLFAGLSWGWIVNAVLSSGAALITTPVVAGCTVLLYFDLRIRLEGFDIEVGAAAHLDRAA